MERVGANAFSYNFQRRPVPGLGEVSVDRQFRPCIKAHAPSEVNREWSTFLVINIGADRRVTTQCYDRGKMKELVTCVTGASGLKILQKFSSFLRVAPATAGARF